MKFLLLMSQPIKNTMEIGQNKSINLIIFLLFYRMVTFYNLINTKRFESFLEKLLKFSLDKSIDEEINDEIY